MSNKYFSGRLGPYIYCDICGQACYINQITKLKSETGRGGLLVCPNDADSIDYGLIPYVASEDRSPQVQRINHTNVINGATPFDIETQDLGV